MADDAEIREAVHEFHEYLSDRIPPLMVVDSVGLLLQGPATTMAAEIGAWAGRQRAIATMPDLLYHGVKKIAVMGEFELVAHDLLTRYLRELSDAILPYCPEGDRDSLRQSLDGLGQGVEANVAAQPQIVHRHQPEAPPGAQPSAISPLVSAGLRRLSLILQRLQPQGTAAPATPEQRSEVAAQFVTTAAAQAKNQKELEEHLQPLREVGMAAELDHVFRTLAGTLAGWGSLTAGGSAAPLGGAGELAAMRQIVSLADDPADAAKRFRELIHAAIEQFNGGNLGRAVVMFDLAEQLVTEQKVKPAFVEPLRKSGHEYMNADRLSKYAEREESRPALRRVLAFFTSLSPEALLHDLDGEPNRDRRRKLLELLEVHGAPARAAAREQLRAFVEGKAEMDAFFPMNLIYLLRAIPRPDDVSLEEEVQLVMKSPGRSSPVPIIKQVIAYLSFTKHEKAERALITFLRLFETMLLQPEGATYAPADVDTLLERTCVALARYGTPRAWKALVDHGLHPETRFGSSLARLAEAGRSQNLSSSPEIVGRLIAALNAELPKTVLGFTVKRNDERIAFLIQALSGTPTPAVQEALQAVVDRYPGQRIAEEAARAIGTLKAAARPETAAGLTGDLQLFGLPDVLQTLAVSQQTGVLNLMNAQGTPEATVLFESGQFRGARFRTIQGADAVYQLFERPFQGTFAFVSRRDHLAGDGLLPACEMVSLILEGVRRHDEFKRAATLVPDGAVLNATGQKWSPLPDEDAGFMAQVFESASAGKTAEACEALWAADSYRIRRLLAHWAEEGALKLG